MNSYKSIYSFYSQLSHHTQRHPLPLLMRFEHKNKPISKIEPIGVKSRKSTNQCFFGESGEELLFRVFARLFGTLALFKYVKITTSPFWVLKVDASDYKISELESAFQEQQDAAKERGRMQLKRVPRSPTLLGKRHGGLLHGGGLLGHGGGGGSGGGGQYVTNINNYGPSHVGGVPHHHVDHHVNYGHGHGGSYAVSGAAAGGHGQAQSQSAAFALGPYSASFSQSQAQGGRRGIFDLFDY